MFNTSRLFGALGIAALIVTATATAASASITPTSAWTVGDCTGEGTRPTSLTATVPGTLEGSTTVRAFNNGDALGEKTADTFNGPQDVVFNLGNLTPGTYSTYVLDYNQPVYMDGFEPIVVETLVVPSCGGTPVAPSLQVITTGECTFNVLYTGPRPAITLDVKGKKVVQPVTVKDTTPGVIEYTINAAGASTKGKNAYVYRILVRADNGLRDVDYVRCA